MLTVLKLVMLRHLISELKSLDEIQRLLQEDEIDKLLQPKAKMEIESDLARVRVHKLGQIALTLKKEINKFVESEVELTEIEKEFII